MSDTEQEERIRERAYFLWQAEGCPEGRAEAHWALARMLEAQAVDLVDEEGKESFPASDPPSHVLITGERRARR